VPLSELPAVDEGQHEAIDEQRAELFHQIQRQGGLTGTHAVQVAEVRVETNLFECAVDRDAEHAVAEGEQAVDRVHRRASGATSGDAWSEHVEALEIVPGSTALHAEHLG
jgi:hypothetical protein